MLLKNGKDYCSCAHLKQLCDFFQLAQLLGLVSINLQQVFYT